MSGLSSFETVVGILSHFPNPVFENNRMKIHTAFFNLKEKHPEYFANLPFWKYSLFPKSKELDEIFISLTPGILSIKNPTYRLYQIQQDKAVRAWSEIPNHADHEDRIKKIAAELAEALQ